MAFIYVRNEDSVVVSVKSEDITTPVGHTKYTSEWDRTLLWVLYKIIRNEDGSFYNSEVSHPDDNDGLF